MSLNSTVILTDEPAIRRGMPWWVVPLICIVVAAGVGVAVSVKLGWWRGGGDVPVSGPFYAVQEMDMDIKIVQSGELSASRFADVENKVEGTTQILWLEKEGTMVEKGAKLVELDASNIVEKKELVDLNVQKSESALKIARELKDIQESQNATLKEAAEVTLELAKLEQKRYVEGVYPQSVADAVTARDMAHINLKNKEEDLERTKALYIKSFVTAADVKKAELEVVNQNNEVKKAEMAFVVLENYTQPMELSRLRSAVAQAEQKLARQIKENASMMAQKIADLNEKESTLDLYNRQAKKLQDQIDKCTIRAPEAGLTIYMSSIDRSMAAMIQEGTMVRYSQILMRLPDVRTMKVVLKVQETQKLKLDVAKNQRARVRILGVPKLIDATLTKVALLPDNSQRWWNPDLKEYPIELLLDETPEGLKPGARAETEIFIDHLERIVAVPMSAIYAAGSDTYVFVRDGDHVKERKVTIGASNETHVQLTSGASAGESVLLLQAGQGRSLLAKAKIKMDEPATRPSPGRFKRDSVTRAEKPESAGKEKGKG